MIMNRLEQIDEHELRQAQYVPLSLDLLEGNETIDYKIYCKGVAGYVLLCQNMTLTPFLLQKLKRIAFTREIFVPAPKAEVLLIKRHVSNSIKPIKPIEGYEELKDDVRNLMNSVGDGTPISTETVNYISDTVEEKLKITEDAVIIENINLIRKKDEYLYTHSVNVSLLNGLMGKWLHLSEHHISTLVQIGLLHDIGKMRIPLEILNKPGKLTKDEFEVIKTHPRHSHSILQEMGIECNEVLDGVFQHHEKMNGTGYLGGLSADSISAFAKITSVSDVYDAMVSERCYKEAETPFQVLSWFYSGRFSDLDMTYVNVFMDCIIEDLKNKHVILSNGVSARVIYISKDNPLYPIVDIAGEIVQTSEDLFPLMMQSTLADEDMDILPIQKVKQIV